MENTAGTVSVTFQEKQGRSYVPRYTSTNREHVYTKLAHEIVSKTLEKCSWIRSIKRRQLYNGFIEITVSYDNGFRSVYTIES